MAEPDDHKGHRKRRGSRGGRPISRDKADHKNRNVIGRQYRHLTPRRGLAIRSDEHAIVYRAAVVLNTISASWNR